MDDRMCVCSGPCGRTGGNGGGGGGGRRLLLYKAAPVLKIDVSVVGSRCGFPRGRSARRDVLLCAPLPKPGALGTAYEMAQLKGMMKLVRTKTQNFAHSLRDLLRLESIRKVDEALEAAHGEATKSFALERFGTRLAMVVVLHAANDAKGGAEPQCCFGWVADNMSWAQFVQQVDSAIKQRSKVAASALTLVYENARTGASVRLTADSLRTWLDDNWLAHPLEVHAYTSADAAPLVAAEAADAEAGADDGNGTGDGTASQEYHARRARECFERYDTDRSGLLSLPEMKAMLSELCVGLDAITDREVDIWAAHEFERADVNHDGTIDAEEFEEYYKGLREHLRKQLARGAAARLLRLQFEEAAVEATAEEVPLKAVMGTAVRLGADSPQHAHYNVSLTLPAADSDEVAQLMATKSAGVEDFNSDRWVRAQTLLPSKMGHLARPDAASSARLTPIVQVEFETRERARALRPHAALQADAAALPGPQLGGRVAARHPSRRARFAQLEHGRLGRAVGGALATARERAGGGVGRPAPALPHTGRHLHGLRGLQPPRRAARRGPRLRARSPHPDPARTRARPHRARASGRHRRGADARGGPPRGALALR